MKKHLLKLIIVLTATTLIFSLNGCKKKTTDEEPVVSSSPKLYDVTAMVNDPTGKPLGGVTVFLKGKPENDPVFSGITNNLGVAKLKSPAGTQTLIAKIGSVFYQEQSVSVKTDNSTVTEPMTLHQNTGLKVLVVFAGCEQLENILDSLGFTIYDTTDIQYMRLRAAADSNALLTYLNNYTLVFSDCNCGDESGFPLLANIYGEYIKGGGKIYGGHYNYMNLQYIVAPYYSNQVSQTSDSVTIIDGALSSYLGFTTSAWVSNGFGGYEQFTDLPPSTKIYAIMTNSTSVVPVIELNYVGEGKYLHTLYHNQDIIDDPNLIKIVKYFLYSL